MVHGILGLYLADLRFTVEHGFRWKIPETHRTFTIPLYFRPIRSSNSTKSSVQFQACTTNFHPLLADNTILDCTSALIREALGTSPKQRLVQSIAQDLGEGSRVPPLKKEQTIPVGE